jgi:hypothetical protein
MTELLSQALSDNPKSLGLAGEYWEDAQLAVWVLRWEEICRDARAPPDGTG